MEFEVKKIFEDVAYFSKVHTKKDYEAQMKFFKEKRYGYLKPLLDAQDTQDAANAFCEETENAFKKFGKVRGGDLMNLNYFMIYYIFPSIQLNEERERAISICDALRDIWNSTFKSNINYSDYDSLMSGFKTKIFGIPIGKN